MKGMDEAHGYLKDGDEEKIGDEGPLTAKAVRNDTEDDLDKADLVKGSGDRGEMTCSRRQKYGREG